MSCEYCSKPGWLWPCPEQENPNKINPDRVVWDGAGKALNGIPVHRFSDYSKNPARWAKEGIKISKERLREPLSLDSYLSFSKVARQRIPGYSSPFSSFSRLWMLRQLWND